MQHASILFLSLSDSTSTCFNVVVLLSQRNSGLNHLELAATIRRAGVSALTMKQAGFTSRELACGAKFTAAELEESGFSDESIGLAGYRSSSWEFGGYTYDISPMVSERLQVV